MDQIIDYFKRLFLTMFRSSTRRYEMRAKAKIRAATVGKLQAKVMKAQTSMDRKVNKAQDKLLPGGKKGGRKGPPAH